MAKNEQTEQNPIQELIRAKRIEVYDLITSYGSMPEDKNQDMKEIIKAAKIAKQVILLTKAEKLK